MNFEAKGYPKIERVLGFSDTGCDFGYLYFLNKSGQGTPGILEETIQFTQLQNVCIMNTQLTPKQECTLKVKPGEEKIIILKRVGVNPLFKC
mmetsp:Transcript_36960/g.35673  ORF Transcript_36960/g.35673 Transcript_36960/m.35673 type:complete len:92 (-) Transcript_36960:690-965(-)